MYRCLRRIGLYVVCGVPCVYECMYQGCCMYVMYRRPKDGLKRVCTLITYQPTVATAVFTLGLAVAQK